MGLKAQTFYANDRGSEPQEAGCNSQAAASDSVNPLELLPFRQFIRTFSDNGCQLISFLRCFRHC
jgi:hypothetical protein